jgi:hypothetical protein
VGLFLYEFFTEDEVVLADGVRNMETWLVSNLDAKKQTEDQETIRDGYTVRDFDLSLLATVRDDVDPAAEGSIAGAAVATQSVFDVDAIMTALVYDDQATVFAETTISHERTYLSGRSCFADRSCQLIDTDNVVDNTFGNVPFDLDVQSKSRSQYRWVNYGTDAEPTWALLNRTWLVDDAVTGGTMGGIVELHEQMYLLVVLPWEDGALVVGNTWVSATITDFSEGVALNMMVNGMKDRGETLDHYLSGPKSTESK